MVKKPMLRHMLNTKHFSRPYVSTWKYHIFSLWRFVTNWGFMPLISFLWHWIIILLIINWYFSMDFLHIKRSHTSWKLCQSCLYYSVSFNLLWLKTPNWFGWDDSQNFIGDRFLHGTLVCTIKQDMNCCT